MSKDAQYNNCSNSEYTFLIKLFYQYNIFWKFCEIYCIWFYAKDVMFLKCYCSRLCDRECRVKCEILLVFGRSGGESKRAECLLRAREGVKLKSVDSQMIMPFWLWTDDVNYRSTFIGLQQFQTIHDKLKSSGLYSEQKKIVIGFVNF